MKIAALLLFCCVVSLPLVAAEPTNESLERLFVVTDVRATLDAVLAGSEDRMKTLMAQALKPYPENEELQQAAAKIGEKFGRDFVAALKWENLKGDYLRLYRETYTQEEVDAQIAFYETPLGQSIVAKGPAVGAKSSAIMQGRYLPLIQGMQESIKEEFGKALRKK